PYASRMVRCTAGQAGAIRAKSHTVGELHCGTAVCDRPDLLAARRVPNLDGPIRTGRGEPFSVRAVRHAIDRVGMAAQGLDQLASRRVPNLDRPICTGGSEPLSIRAVDDAVDRVGVILEREEVHVAQALEVVPFPVAPL